jgi:hypothetical protein
MTIEEKRVDYLTANKSAMLRAEADQADVRMSAVGLLSTQAASLRFSSAGATLPRGDVTMSFSNGQLVTARNDMHIANGGGQVMAAANSIDVRNGGAGLMVARQIRVERGAVGLLLAQQAELADGVRVLLQPAGAAAVGVGAGVGFAAGLLVLWRLFRRAAKKS